MNIGIFTDTYYPQINGVATSVRILERELNKLGHKVYIFTTTDPNAPYALPRVFRLPSMPFVFLPSHRMAFMYSPKLLMRLKRLKLDIVHTQTEFPLGIFGRIVSDFYKIPSVHTYHTMYEDYVHYIANGHLITPKMAQQFSRVFCNRAKAVITPVEKTKASLIEYGVTKPITVIPTGIDFTPFSPEKYTEDEVSTIKAELGINQNDPVIVFIGRVAKEKSIDIIVKALPKLLEKLPSTKFTIVGDGPAADELKDMAIKLNIENSVIFAGSKPWDQIGKYYQIGDVFVTASTSETQGLTYIEAIASKTPVIAKKDRSIEGIINHGETGFVFETDEQLPELLEYVLQKKEMKILTENAFSRISNLSSEQFGQNIENLYMELIRDYRPRKEPFSILKAYNLLLKNEKSETSK